MAVQKPVVDKERAESPKESSPGQVREERPKRRPGIKVCEVEPARAAPSKKGCYYMAGKVELLKKRCLNIL